MYGYNVFLTDNTFDLNTRFVQYTSDAILERHTRKKRGFEIELRTTQAISHGGTVDIEFDYFGVSLRLIDVASNAPGQIPLLINGH